MRREKGLVPIFIIVLFWGLVFPVQAQMVDIGKFERVQIPYRLKWEDTVIEKGTYSLEFVKSRDSTACYLKIIKGKKVLCLIMGERIDYVGGGGMLEKNIPDKPTLKMKIDNSQRLYIFNFETGKFGLFPYLRLRFKLKIAE